VGAGHAEHPFEVGELRGEIVSLAELYVDLGGLVGRNHDRLRPFEHIAGGADGERIVAGGKLRRRKAERALGVAHYADGDDALLGAHHHAFHGAFGGGGDRAGECGGRLVLREGRGQRGCGEQRQRQDGKHRCGAHRFLPDDRRLSWPATRAVRVQEHRRVLTGPQPYQLAEVQLSQSFTRSLTSLGSVRPLRSSAARLTLKSTDFVAATGKSAGLAPRRIKSTYLAAP